MARDNDVLRTCKQIAHALGVSERTLKRMIRAGRLPAVQKGCSGGKTSPLVMPAAAVNGLLKRGG